MQNLFKSRKSDRKHCKLNTGFLYPYNAYLQYVKRMISFFVIEGEVIKSNGEIFYTENQKFVIPEYEGFLESLIHR